jgi:quercetin dioxygenase-like cupin family protein
LRFRTPFSRKVERAVGAAVPVDRLETALALYSLTFFTLPLGPRWQEHPKTSITTEGPAASFRLYTRARPKHMGEAHMTWRVGNLVGLGMLCVLATSTTAGAHDNPVSVSAHSASDVMKATPKLETLLKAVLQGVDSTEVIVSRVSLPPHTTLPKHWHPGEEFAYVLEGSAALWQEGKDDIVAKAGDVLKVPLRQVHTAITKDEGATFLVFRVHKQGRPERVLVED